MTQPNACPVCGEKSHSPVLSKNGYDIVRCTNCGLMHVSPTPSDTELTAHYQNAAYFAGEAEQGYADYGDMEKALIPFFTRRLSVLAKHFPNGGRLLDFGCAAGYFLKMAQAAGWEISGVELSRSMAEIAEKSVGIPIAADIHALPAEKAFDAITLWEVIEHLPRPLDTLRAFHARLRSGGAVMLSTPNTAHWQAQRAPDRWVGYRPPSHLLYFTPETLEDILHRAGFTRVSVRRVSPLPPLPRWLDAASRPLANSLADGSARPWRLALLAWRAIRILGWGWQKLAHPTDDIFTTLEAIAFKS